MLNGLFLRDNATGAFRDQRYMTLLDVVVNGDGIVEKFPNENRNLCWDKLTPDFFENRVMCVTLNESDIGLCGEVARTSVGPSSSVLDIS
ncbi:hypothetical protein FRX31_019746 [Thalictrum thalictroides]|uniref:Uncharacterized protein n=1 Tax=Thalictrum thalictroides TaxID=46969 RepID=A0A7J6VZW8_THATH|nr:hypothetical protein FRX31_019746 [Thalictrum thalictroides]